MTMTKLVKLLATLSIACFALAARAETFYVNAACGNDDWTGTSADCVAPDGPKATIQAALDAALHFDTVIVYPGTYVENVNFAGELIDLRSTDPADPAVVAETIIDGGGSGSAVDFAGAPWEVAALRGFTVTGGVGEYGGGISGNDSYATVEDCVITGNEAEENGGGIHGVHGPISRCVIADNYARGDSFSGSGGGGLSDCHGPITDCVIASNRASDNGGGLAYCGGEISGCVITLNFADAGGGVFECQGTISRCTIVRNDGGGIAECDGLIEDCRIALNASPGYGAGAGVDACGGTITGCVIVDNFPTGIAGDFTRLTNCVVARNGRVGVDGAGTITHCTIADHWEYGVKGTFTITNSVLAKNDFEATSLEDGSSLSYSCVDRYDGEPGPGMIVADPQFAFKDDFRLRPTSPCIDAAADSEVAFDLDGRPRPLGDAPDMGAFEYAPAAAVVAASPGELTLLGALGGELSDAGTIEIANVGGAALAWELSADVPWLTFEPASGTGAATVTIQAEVTGLPQGIHTATLAITPAEGAGVPRELPITLAVAPHYLVSQDGTGDFTDIQAALDAAEDGTRITVAPSEYVVSLEFPAKWIELQSTDPLDPEVVRSTVLVRADAFGEFAIMLGANGPSRAWITGFSFADANPSQTHILIGQYRDSHLDLEHCRFARRTGVAIASVHGRIAHCVFANSLDGARLITGFEGELVDCQFFANMGTVGSRPGMVDIRGRVRDCLFAFNASLSGALLSLHGTLADSVFLGNGFNARSGYMQILLVEAGWVEDCAFVDNHGSSELDATTRVSRCVFVGGRSPYGAQLSGGLVENSLFVDNRVSRSAYSDDAAVQVTSAVHCSFATNSPRALHVGVDGGEITNCVFWNNAQPALLFGVTTFRGCLVPGGVSAIETEASGEVVWGPGSADAVPTFFDTLSWHGASNSPAIDAGIDSDVALDLEGAPRPLGAAYDAGAFEYNPSGPTIAAGPAVVYIEQILGFDDDTAATLSIANSGTGTLEWSISSDAAWLTAAPAQGTSTGESTLVTLAVDEAAVLPGFHLVWLEVTGNGAANSPRRIPVVVWASPARHVYADGSGAHASVQAAIDVADPGDTIIVHPGTYYENISFEGKDIVVRGTDFNDPDVVASTIIDGGGIDSVVRLFSADDEDFDERFQSPLAKLTGLTITNGYAEDGGGGIRGDYASGKTSFATISHCVISGNAAPMVHGVVGGGIYGCDGVISHCVIRDNAALVGGGIGVLRGTIRDSVIRNNFAGRDGGGMTGHACRIERCIIANNVVDDDGAAAISVGEAEIISCLISGNIALESPGGAVSSRGRLVNCTIVGNAPAGIVQSSSTPAELVQCIVRDNREASVVIVHEDGEVLARYSNIAGGWPGEGNIDADPLFVAPGMWDDGGTPEDPADDTWIDGDFRLQPGSPSINTGDPDFFVALDQTDLAGNDRLAECIIDMGAYESAGGADCNDDGVPDACDFIAGAGDCNGNGIPDACDIADGTSSDDNGNGFPDECELPADVNCDGAIDGFDIEPFVLALTDPDAYAATYPDCNLINADVNGDGAVNGFDIEPFVAELTGND